MKNEIVTTKKELPLSLEMPEQELMKVLRESVYPDAQDESIKMVRRYCLASGLDPLHKPLHIVPMWHKKSGSMRDVIMPGIGLYRTQAARSGQYAGVSDPQFGPQKTEKIGGVQITYPEWCRVVVKRMMSNGSIAEFSSIEMWIENYATEGKDRPQPNAMWKKRPYGQIAKCAEAQALRKAFPEFGSQPTAEEMEGKYIDDAVTVIDNQTGEILNKKEPQKEKTKELPAYTDAQLEKNLQAWQEGLNENRITIEKIIAKVTSGYTLTEAQIERIRGLQNQSIDNFVSEIETYEQQVSK